MLAVSDLNIGKNNKYFFNKQMEFLKKLSNIDKNLLLFGNIFYNKNKVNLYSYNIFSKILLKFDNIIILQNENDTWLENDNNINTMFLLEKINTKIITQTEIIKKIAFIPKFNKKEDYIKSYKTLENNKDNYKLIITNDLTSKYAISEKKIPIISNETNGFDNVTNVKSFNYNIYDDINDLFAYDISNNKKIKNDTHPKTIRIRIEDFKKLKLDNIKGNYVILTSEKKYKNIYKRNKYISLVVTKLKELGAKHIDIKIKDHKKKKHVDVKNICDFIKNNVYLDNKMKKRLIDELKHIDE